MRTYHTAEVPTERQAVMTFEVRFNTRYDVGDPIPDWDDYGARVDFHDVVDSMFSTMSPWGIFTEVRVLECHAEDKSI